jgi:hypothetical protein
MHGVHTKIKEFQQAKIYIYKNVKWKLLKINAASWFSKMSRPKQLTPKYIRIKERL